MAKLTPPRAGIPVGTVTVAGVTYDAEIHPEWHRYLAFGLFERVGGVVAPSNNDLDSFLQFDIREADAAELQKRVSDIESVSEYQSFSAMAELVKRVADLEASLALVDALNAQVAQLSARISDQEMTGVFK